jgi:hypothetical protein
VLSKQSHFAYKSANQTLKIYFFFHSLVKAGKFFIFWMTGEDFLPNYSDIVFIQSGRQPFGKGLPTLRIVNRKIGERLYFKR